MDTGIDRHEVELIRQGRLGDENALGSLVDLHASALIGYISRLTGDLRQAEDLAQDTFVRVFENLDKFDSRRPFRPWLLRIGRNLALNYLSSRIEKERKLTEPIDETAHGAVEGPDRILIIAETRRTVRTILGVLPVHFREVLHLRYMEGMGYSAIARELDLPVGTVKTWLFRAKQAFLKEAESAGISF